MAFVVTTGEKERDGREGLTALAQMQHFIPRILLWKPITRPYLYARQMENRIVQSERRVTWCLVGRVIEEAFFSL